MARELSVLLNFARDGESNLASLGRFKVLGATCSGGGHLPTPGYTQDCHDIPGDPFRPYCGVRIGPNLEGKNSQKCNSKYLDEFT